MALLLENHEIEVWDVDAARSVRQIELDEPCRDVALSDDGQHPAIVAGDGKTVRDWGTEDGREWPPFEVDETIVSLNMSPSGRYIIAVGESGEEQVWDSFISASVARIARLVPHSGPGRLRDVFGVPRWSRMSRSAHRSSTMRLPAGT